MGLIKDLTQLNSDIQEQKERVENVDFKMITFSLAGKEYGVDIMSVKEIAKADKFTYVPNAASFIRGVYNLRGDIIPIIDFRTFFQIPVEKKECPDTFENMLILRINDQVYGTIVDKIDKVIGINRESIQPPHPIFGDINVKYISGVVEKQGSLYIIIDVIRIFSIEEDKPKALGSVSDSGAYKAPPPVITEDEKTQQAITATDSAIDFIKEGLAALKRFIVTDINEGWLRRRFADWSIGRTGSDLQLQNVTDANEFLKGFESPCTDMFWSEDYAAAVEGVLPDFYPSSKINVWNIGCGKGYETYSFACILKNKYPDAMIKIWANDNDIMSISQAPNMAFELEDIPEYCRKFMTKGNSGYSFSQAIKDAVVFEYHDVQHENSLPELDIILARDILSYLPEHGQAKITAFLKEQLKSRGIVFLGKNEEFTGEGWRLLADGPVSAYLRIE